jgi:protein SCO1/2
MLEHKEADFTLPKKSFFTPLNIAVLVVATLPLFFTGMMMSRGGRALPVLGDAPEFSLVDQSGAPVSKAGLKGKVWLASFLFSNCPDVCPRTLNRLKGTKLWLEEKRPELLPDFRFVGFSLDPVGDTPESVREFLVARGHDLDQWHYLLSDSSLHALANEGFRIGVRAGENGLAAAHSDHVLLVDRSGKIRGFYGIGTNEGLARFHGDLEKVLKETTPPEG